MGRVYPCEGQCLLRSSNCTPRQELLKWLLLFTAGTSTWQLCEGCAEKLLERGFETSVRREDGSPEEKSELHRLRAGDRSGEHSQCPA